MSTMPPISSLGSAPVMVLSSPAAATASIQLRRSLFATFATPPPPNSWAKLTHRRGGDNPASRRRKAAACLAGAGVAAFAARTQHGGHQGESVKAPRFSYIRADSLEHA